MFVAAESWGWLISCRVCEESSALMVSPASLAAEETQEPGVSQSLPRPAHPLAGLTESWSPGVSVGAECELMEVEAAAM